MARKYELQDLVEAVKIADNKAQVLEILKMAKSGASYLFLDKKIKEHGLDISHWYNKKHNRKQINLSDILVENSNYQSDKLRKRLISCGLLEYKCGNIHCGISEWLGKAITLQLEHINGIHSDNRIENLMLLCPNCHTQTETWGMKKR